MFLLSNKCGLLSSQVQQLESSEEPELVATNGKMLHLLTRSGTGGVYSSLSHNKKEEGDARWRRAMKQGTRGVLHLLTRSTTRGGGYAPPIEKQDGALWHRVLEHGARQGADALIDAGGLLAGATNRQAADYLLQILDSSR